MDKLEAAAKKAILAKKELEKALGVDSVSPPQQGNCYEREIKFT